MKKTDCLDFSLEKSWNLEKNRELGLIENSTMKTFIDLDLKLFTSTF